MRWSWRDWVAGLVVIGYAATIYPLAVPFGREVRLLCWGLRPGTSRTEVERSLGQPTETVSPYYCICIKPSLSGSNPEWTRELIHTESCRYSHPLGTINVEYRGYRDQRVTSAEFVPTWSLMGIAYLLAIPLVLVTSAELARAVRREIRSLRSRLCP